MLKKENRLSGLIIKAKSENFDSPLFRIKVFPGSGEEIKFGFIVSKKIDKKAVVRNKTKRVLKKAAKVFVNKLTKGINIIIIAKTNLDFTKEKLTEETMGQVFNKAKVLK